MKKLLIMLVAGASLTWLTAACDSEPKNPGDFNVACELTLDNVVQSIGAKNGRTYPLVVFHENPDTQFRVNYVLRDTVWAADGTVEKVNTTDTFYLRRAHIHFYDTECIMLPFERDTLEIKLFSNARWNCPAPERKGIPWLFNQINSGGGDNKLLFNTDINFDDRHIQNTSLYVFTSDSAVMYRLNFNQYGFGEKPE